MMSPQHRIGVLTFHRCINYGSYWQARCLVEGLRARGHDAVLLDHDCPKVKQAEYRCAFQPLLPKRTPRHDFPYYARKARELLRAVTSLPLTAPFPLDEPDRVGDFDLILVGSDEVWNLRHPWYGGRSVFYGDRLPAKRLASYAASFGNHDASEGLDGRWSEKLRRFSAISVRDENSRRMVRDAIGVEPALVLDPCLQFPPAIDQRETAEDAPYVAVYGHSFPSWYAEAVRQWARWRGYRIVSIGYRNDWADEQRIGEGPLGFVRLIAGSRAVATNFFHGCVFSLIAAKPFACASTPYRSNKVWGLTRALGAEAHMAEEGIGRDRLDRLLGAPLDPSIFARIAALRGQSDRYLAHALA